MAVKRSRKKSWALSIGFHGLLIALLFMSLEKTIFVPADPAPQAQPKTIDAVMVNTQALQQEKQRLKAIEQKREDAIAQKEKQVREKQLQEEARLAELKQKTEQLKKEAEQQKLAQQKEAAAQEAKIKAEQVALKQLQKEKTAALAEKQKREAQEKAAAQAPKAEPAPVAESQASTPPPGSAEPVKQTVITHYAMLMRNKIHQNWRQPIGLDIAGFKCKVAVKLMPTGDVIDAQVVQSSGSLEFDRSTELAVRKASPLPVPDDPEVAKEFRQFTFTFHPEAA